MTYIVKDLGEDVFVEYGYVGGFVWDEGRSERVQDGQFEGGQSVT